MHVFITAQQNNMIIGSELIGRTWHGIHLSGSAHSQDVQAIPLTHTEINHCSFSG